MNNVKQLFRAASWQKTALGELLARSEETIDPVAEQEYREITVRLWGNGVIERGRVLGGSLSGRRFVACSRRCACYQRFPVVRGQQRPTATRIFGLALPHSRVR